jgi:drug/metabolite transporter (DMT)-like permease
MSQMETNQNTKGIFFIMTGMAFFSIQDSLIKYIYEDVALFELYFGRTLIQSIILLSFVLLTKKTIVLKTHYPILTLVRVVCFFFGFSFFYISLTFMTLAMTSALFFSCPFFMSMFAKFFLKEKIGIRRWSAILIGFIGVLIVLNPTLEEFNFFKLAPVACALCYATSMTITKYTSDKDSIYTQMTWLYIFAIFASIIIFLVSGDGKFNNFSDSTMQFIFREWFTNPAGAWPYVLIMGIVASISFFCVFSAYSIASPSIVSLFEYSYIVWAMLAGYILFETVPVPRTFIGAAIIIGAGFYIYFREKVRGQMIATDTPNR